jgi:MHS family proline/betaine transporter-like MFS transporter
MSASASTKLTEPSSVLTGRQIVLAAAASVFGWGLDLFDLLILLYVAPIIGRLFFPAGNPMLSLAATYASFAVTLLMRPLGSAIFGTYADRSGRRKALIIAVVGVGVTTAIFGALPTVDAIGWAASFLFVLFRFVQGIFVGGVVASSHTIGTESVPERWRGLMSGAVGGGGSALGGLLASLVFYIVTLLAPGPALADWGWRLMFASSLLTTIIGIVLFHNLEESPLFAALQARKAAARATHSHAEPGLSPIASLFSPAHRRVFLVNLLLTLGAGAGYYLTSGYLPTFFSLVNKVPGHQASIILIGVNISAALGALACGELSEHLGRKTVFLAMGVVRLVAFPLLYLAMADVAGLGVLAIYALLLAFVANGSYGHLLIFLNERFPTALRATGTGLSWNVGFALGGIMPTFVSLASGSAQGLPTTLAIFSGVVSAIYLIGALAVPETRGNLRRI